MAFTCKLMVELSPSFSAGLGKRKRVMDEKELMTPLELGYVQAAEKQEAPTRASETALFVTETPFV